MTISGFFKEYRWLSNFHRCDIDYMGKIYPTTEHAYQAAKTDDEEEKEYIRQLETPAMAQKAGQKIKLVPEWDCFRFLVMRNITWVKFANHPDLKEKLLATGDEELVETNYWHDNVWGSCTCNKCGNKGQNMLGKILMEIREELKNES